MCKINLSPDFVKFFALIAMTADHVDKLYVHATLLDHTIGRMAFPIFSFLIISNFYTYHPVKKYLWRLLGFGILTQIAFHVFEIPLPTLNILFTFLWAIIFIQSSEWVCSKTKSLIWQFYWVGLLFLILQPLICMSDYSLFGFLFLISLYVERRNPSKLNCLAVFLSGIIMNSSSIMAAVTTGLTLFGLLFLFNISGGKRLFKWWFFYLYYPLHLVIIQLLKGAF